MQVELTGKAAIVTGAASGIGLAIVLEYLASDIHWLVAVDVTREPPEQIADARKRHPDRLVYGPGDVTLEETAKTFTALAIGESGRIDVMVNNAGVSVVRPLHDHTESEWDLVVDTNAKAPYWAARHVVHDEAGWRCDPQHGLDLGACRHLGAGCVSAFQGRRAPDDAADGD